MIERLSPDEIFVFGSNLMGDNIGGAARQAKDKFGAEDGIGEGLSGRCYAFPTLTKLFEKRKYLELEESKNRLYATARALPEKTFLLTKVGCGIAGYPENVMKVLFTNAPKNIVMPEGW